MILQNYQEILKNHKNEIKDLNFRYILIIVIIKIIMLKSYQILKENHSNNSTCQFRNLESQNIIKNYHLDQQIFSKIQEKDALEISET